MEQILQKKNLRVEGFHIYSGTQCLKADAIVQNYEIFIRIFKTLSANHDIRPRKLVFGGGLGIPHHDEDQPLALDAVAAQIIPALDALKQDERFAETELVLEVGRYLVGEAGRYLTRVINVKRSRGVLLAICDGGMNHHLAACGLMGSVIPRNYRMSKAGTSPDGPAQTYELTGPLCTTIDRFGRKVRMPGLQAGDVIAVECSGAYGLTASPVHFISHAPPKEAAIETIKGSLQVDDISEMRPDFL
jgi:diaminopimelate decarboxylase